MSAEPASVISTIFQPRKKQGEKAQRLDENFSAKSPRRKNPKDKKIGSKIALAWQPAT